MDNEQKQKELGCPESNGLGSSKTLNKTTRVEYAKTIFIATPFGIDSPTQNSCS
jgi:hypothetical protein